MRATIHALVAPTQLTSAVGCSEEHNARVLHKEPEQIRSMCTLRAFQADIWILFRSRSCACRSCKISHSMCTKGGCTFPFVTFQLLLTKIARHKQETYLVPRIKGRLKLWRGLLCWSGARRLRSCVCEYLRARRGVLAKMDATAADSPAARRERAAHTHTLTRTAPCAVSNF